MTENEHQANADAVDPPIEDLDAPAPQLENVVGGGAPPARLLYDVTQNNQKGSDKNAAGADLLIRG